MELTSTTLGDLARAHPSATRVFLRHRLDFCCGGQRTLTEACTRAGLDAQQIANEIASEAASDPDRTRWDTRTPKEITDHIVQRYHDGLRKDLPPLIEAARKVERVHAGKPSVPVGLASHLEEFWSEMQSHMMKEEQVLFPMLRGGAHGRQVYMPVRMMEQEHDSHGRALERVRELTGDLVIPAGACATWTALYRGLEAIEADLMEHIHLENNVLFLRATREG